MERSSELHKALVAVSSGSKTDGINKEALEVARILLETNELLAKAEVTPASNFFVRNIVRMLDSMFVAYVEQSSATKRARSMVELVSRINRELAEIGLPTLK